MHLKYRCGSSDSGVDNYVIRSLPDSILNIDGIKNRRTGHLVETIGCLIHTAAYLKCDTAWRNAS
jgi:hypothetical protein